MADVASAPGEPFARFVLRGREAFLEAAGRAFGVPLPRAACRSAQAGDRAALWLGPDEQLLLAPAAERDALDATLAVSTAGLAGSLVEVGSRQVALQVRGAQVEALLNAGCPLDLDLSAFPVGMCTRTLLGKAEIVLWRTAPDAFHIEVWRSFSAYVQAYLQEAALGVAA